MRGELLVVPPIPQAHRAARGGGTTQQEACSVHSVLRRAGCALRCEACEADERGGAAAAAPALPPRWAQGQAQPRWAQGTGPAS
jgi:hypothetical protein